MKIPGIRFLGFSTDMSDQARHFDQSFFKLACDASLNHIIITDTEGIITYANDAAERNTGFTRAEMFGNTPRLWGKQMSQGFYQGMWKTIKTDKASFSGQLTNKRKNGELYIVNARISPLISDDGTLQGFVGIENEISDLISARIKAEERAQQVAIQNADLTDAKKAMMNLLEDAETLKHELMSQKSSVEQQIVERTKELQEERSKLLASIEALTKGYAMLDTEGAIVLTNRRLSSVLRAPEGSSWTLDGLATYLHGYFDIKDAFQRCIATQQMLRFDEIPYKDRILQVRFNPVLAQANPGSGQTIIGALCIVGDVTEERILERSKDEFFSIASHELRTPLTAIRGNTSLMLEYYREKLQDPDLIEMVSDVHDSSIRLINIVNDFLNVGRLEQHRIEFKNSAFDILDLVRKQLSEYTRTGTQKNLDIRLIEPNTALPRVFADPDRVREVFINLVGNSIKYTDQGSISVVLAPVDREIVVTIEDTGRGIPLSNQSLLFHKFQQAGDSLFTRDTTKGTGLGLYISKLLIEGMHGRIWLVRSEQGKGSSFAFSVPIDPTQPY